MFLLYRVRSSAYTRRFNKHSEEGSVGQDKKVKGVVNLAIGKELFVASSFAEDNSEASLEHFPLSLSVVLH